MYNKKPITIENIYIYLSIDKYLYVLMTYGMVFFSLSVFSSLSTFRLRYMLFLGSQIKEDDVTPRYFI